MVFFAASVCSAQGQDSILLKITSVEQDIKKLCRLAFYSKIESERIQANKDILVCWNKIIHYPAVLSYPFDSLKKDISVLQPADGKFKLITWNIFKDDGSYFYFGFLAVNQSKRIKTGIFSHRTVLGYESFQLQDKSPGIKSPESYIGSVDKWFGMLYYRVIDGDGFYTLLGYDPNDKLTQRKFIDVLSFKADGNPVFGKDVFRVPKKNPKRMMFEYGSGVTMSLRYDEANQRITFSHLSAKDEGNMLDGQFQFYGPDGSFDALVLKKDKWKNEKWQLEEDIDARNIKSKNDNAEKPNPKKQKPIYKPK
jgi:hypothetical protein